MKTPPQCCVPSDHFSSPEVCAIIEEYEKRGGHVESLKQVVRFLSPKTSKGKRISRRAWDKTLRECRESIGKALALDDLRGGVRHWLTMAVKYLDARLAPTLSYTELEENWRRCVRKPGRPMGPTLPSLIPAILAEEFKKRFEEPRHDYILALVRAVAPKIFLQSTVPDYIRRRIEYVNKKFPGVAQREHDRLFP